MKPVADTLGVSGSNLVERLKGRSKPRGSYHKAEDAELLPIIRRLVNQRPTYGYRRIAALLNRERRAADKPVVNAKRVHRIMGNHAMLLEKHTAVRKGRLHDGKVMVMRSNLRYCFLILLTFVKTLKRDYIRISALPNAETGLRLIDGWIEDYNEIHPHSAHKMASPRQFIRAKSN
jgi:transposase InsO family protein